MPLVYFDEVHVSAETRNIFHTLCLSCLSVALAKLIISTDIYLGLLYSLESLCQALGFYVGMKYVRLTIVCY